MPTMTIRNVPVSLYNRIKKSAKLRGVSMEQEARDTLSAKYAARDATLAAIRKFREANLPTASLEEILRWRDEGRR